jgi:hypothetical protein
MSDFGITVNITRKVIREVILGAIKELQDEEGFDMRDIISELLSIASAAVTRLDDINEVTISTLGEELDASDDEDEYDEEAVKRLTVIELQEELDNSDINKQIQSLLEKRDPNFHIYNEKSMLARLTRDTVASARACNAME